MAIQLITLDNTQLGRLIKKIYDRVVKKSETTEVQSVGIDNTPTLNSQNLVLSGGVASELAKKYEKPSGGIPASDIASGVIPSVPVTDVTVGGTSVLNSGTAVIPAIPTVPTISTDIETDKASNTKTASPKAVYDEVHPAVATTQPAGGMLPNVFYNLGTLSGNTTFSFASASDANIKNEWMFQFITPATAPTITWPADITSWMGGVAPVIKENKTYQVSVVNGLGIIAEF